MTQVSKKTVAKKHPLTYTKDNSNTAAFIVNEGASKTIAISKRNPSAYGEKIGMLLIQLGKIDGLKDIINEVTVSVLTHGYYQGSEISYDEKKEINYINFVFNSVCNDMLAFAGTGKKCSGIDMFIENFLLNVGNGEAEERLEILNKMFCCFIANTPDIEKSHLNSDYRNRILAVQLLSNELIYYINER